MEEKDKEIQFNIQYLSEAPSLSLVLLDIREKGELTTKVWLLPSQDYCVFKMEIYYSGKTIEKSDIRYEKIDGVYFPVASTSVTKRGGVLLEKKVMNVTFTESRPNRIPDSLFTLKIPRNAVVENLDTGEIIMDPSELGEYLDTIPIWQSQRAITMLLVNASLLAILVYVNRRRLKKLLWK